MDAVQGGNYNNNADQVVPIQDDNNIPVAAEGAGANSDVEMEHDDEVIGDAYVVTLPSEDEDDAVANNNEEEIAFNAHEFAIVEDDDGNDAVLVLDEAGDVNMIVEENEITVPVLEAENAGEAAQAGEAAVVFEEGSSSAAAANDDSGGGNIFLLENFPHFVNKSVLWDLEAPILGSFFQKYESENSERSRQVADLMNNFGTFMDNFLNVDIMSNLSNEEAHARLKELLEYLKLRKAKYQEIMKRMESAAIDVKNCVNRIKHHWSDKRLDRALVNHLLRMRYINTAYNLAVKSGIEDLFDFKAFREADGIINALRNKDFQPAKAWCDKNASWSKVSIEIFCQEYIELVRKNQKMNALAFASKHEEELQKIDGGIRQVLAVIAFGRDTHVLRYKKLFDDERWEFLIKLFWEQFIKMQRFTDDASSLCILLEAGITALKVPFCFDGEDCKKDDPLQHEPVRTFASTLPHTRHCFPPKLLCHVTKKPLGEQNPPWQLPNGYAYSLEAIMGMKNGDGQIICPRTGNMCNAGEIKALKLNGYIYSDELFLN